MRLGQLRHKLVFQRAVEVQDPVSGDMVPSWEDAFKAWCAIEYLSVREFITSNTEKVQISARLKTRFREDVTPDMRALYRGKIFNIHGVLPDNMSGRNYITMPVSEGLNNG